jgi:hypothetical protein
MNPLEYLHLQLRLEGKEIIDGSLLRQIELVPDEKVPLLLIAQLADSNVIAYFDEALQAEFLEALRKQVSAINFPNIDPLCAVLQNRNIAFEAGHYKTYTFPESDTSFGDESVIRFSRQDPKVQAFGFDGLAEQVYGIERHGNIVSACVSTRENDFCGEAWVYTDPEHRRQGLAQKVVTAWANGLLSAGRVPFYSHKIQNDASANLAKRLGLKPLFEEIVISYSSERAE